MSNPIDAKTVMTLREKSGAGMMECKRALTETGGDMEAAIDLLRKKSGSTLIKKSERETKDGVIAQAILPGAKIGVLVEINCETDFVAKNDSFRAFCDEVARKIAHDPAVDLEGDRAGIVQKIGENVVIRRHQRVEVGGHGLVAAYIHTGAKIGVLVEMTAEKEGTAAMDDFKQLIRDITLHIAASNPICVTRSEVPEALVAREREIFKGQVPPGKPANIVEKIVDGKMDKFYSTNCLLDQAFIKDPDKTISQLIESHGKTLGEKLELKRFIRYMVGEEIATGAAA